MGLNDVVLSVGDLEKTRMPLKIPGRTLSWDPSRSVHGLTDRGPGRETGLQSQGHYHGQSYEPFKLVRGVQLSRGSEL